MAALEEMPEPPEVLSDKGLGSDNPGIREIASSVSETVNTGHLEMSVPFRFKDRKSVVRERVS
jgi:hypothetical protein